MFKKDICQFNGNKNSLFFYLHNFPVNLQILELHIGICKDRFLFRGGDQDQDDLSIRYSHLKIPTAATASLLNIPIPIISQHQNQFRITHTLKKKLSKIDISLIPTEMQVSAHEICLSTAISFPTTNFHSTKS